MSLLATALSFALSAQPFEVRAPIGSLTAAQQQWVETFEAGARLHADTGLPAADWLAASERGARNANLRATADYLDVGADVLRGAASLEELEKAFRRTLDEPVYVMLRILERQLADVVVAVPRKVPEELSRVATLRFRAGKAVASPSPASYLPFDRSLNAQVGRTWIVYDNLLPAGWFAARVKPAAEKVLPSLASHVTADAHLRWYAARPPLYDAGKPLSRAELDRFGDDRDALRILKADVFCTLASGATDDDLATLLALSLLTYQEASVGEAPAAHKVASAILINRGIASGALQFANDRWSADLDKLAGTVRTLASELLAIEATVDVPRARALVMKHGHATPALDRTAGLLASVPRTTLVPRFAVSPAGVVRSYLASTTHATAVAHFADDYTVRFGSSSGGMSKAQAAAMLEWDFALEPEHRLESFEARGDTVTVRQHETNEFARLIGFPGWRATSTYVIRNGLIASQHYQPAADQEEWKPYLDKALPWLREHRPAALARLYPNGRLNQTAEAAKEWVEVLRAWRAAN